MNVLRRRRLFNPPPNPSALERASKAELRQRELMAELERAKLDRLTAVSELWLAGWTQERIGEAIGISKPRAQQLVADARRAGLIPAGR